MNIWCWCVVRYFLAFQLGWLVTAVEWCVFACNHNTKVTTGRAAFLPAPVSYRPSWQMVKKNEQMWFDNCLRLSKKVLLSPVVSGFWTPLGMWVVSGLHGLPLWLDLYQCGLLTPGLHLPVWILGLGTFLLVTGRLLALIVEVEISSYRNSVYSS